MAPKGTPEEQVALVQQHQLEQLQHGLQRMDHHRAKLHGETERQGESLSQIEAQLAALYASAGLEREADAIPPETGVLSSLQLTPADFEKVRAALPDFSVGLDLPQAQGDWGAYLKKVEAYAKRNEIELSRDPFETLLSPHRVAEITRKFDDDFGNDPWDAWDYSAVGATVLVASLVDYFLVALPITTKSLDSRTVTFKGKEYRGSPVTAWLREQSDTILSGKGNALQRKLGELSKMAEKYAKVSYDIAGNGSIKGDGVVGLRPAMHRLMSPGHDPVLGAVFGVMDVLKGNCTLVDGNGAWQIITPDMRHGEVPRVDSILEALSLVFAHLFSDIFTPAGVPAPFMTVLQSIKVDTSISVREGGVSLQMPDMIRYMYANGYDLRHFATMSLVPLVAEVMIRTYHGVRIWQGGGQTGVKGIRGEMKQAKLLLATHALLGCTNLVKVGLNGWNPTAFNYAQALALGKQLFVMLMVIRKRDALIESQIADGLESLLAESHRMSGGRSLCSSASGGA